MTSLAYVRRAEATDSPAIASLLFECWQERFGDVWPPSVWESATVHHLRTAWNEALSTNRGNAQALVAIDDGRVVGFADWQEAAPQIAELRVWEVAPTYRRRGHGARLIAAVADTAHDLGVEILEWWSTPQDTHRMPYLREMGWELDGATRSLGNDDTAYVMHQHRWCTSLVDHQAE